MNIFFDDNGERYIKNFVSLCQDFNVYDSCDNESVDVLVLDGTSILDKYRNRKVNTCFCPSSRYFDVINSMRVQSAVSCGMRERDSITFSSIGENDAMVCLKRNILFVDSVYEPCEFRVEFDRKKGLYANLVLGTLEYFVKNGGVKNVFKAY